MLLCSGCHLNILFREDADDACGDFVVYDSSVVLADNVDTEFLRKGQICYNIEKTPRTTMSSLLSSNGSDSRPSGLSRSPLMKVPLELLTSLMNICKVFNKQ